MSEEAELQQAAATGAAAAVGEVANQQRVEAEAEEARAAAATSAEIAQVAAEASQLASESARAAIAEANASQQVAQSAVEQAGSAQEEISSLRAELSSVRDGFGQLTQAVRSLLDLNASKSGDTNVQAVQVDATPDPGKNSEGTNDTESSTGNSDGGSDRRSRHKFGRR